VPYRLESYTNKGKGKEKKKERRGKRRRREKKAMIALLVFIMATLKKNCSTEEVNLAVTFSKCS